MGFESQVWCSKSEIYTQYSSHRHPWGFESQVWRSKSEIHTQYSSHRHPWGLNPRSGVVSLKYILNILVINIRGVNPRSWHSKSEIYTQYLPPAYEVWGQGNIFTGMCHSVHGVCGSAFPQYHGDATPDGCTPRRQTVN